MRDASDKLFIIIAVVTQKMPVTLVLPRVVGRLRLSSVDPKHLYTFFIERERGICRLLCTVL